MSMFYELMMKNKAKTMYATIKGSLTENNGVFSGFSATNYLQLQEQIKNLDINSNIEIVIKCKRPNYTGTNFVFGNLDGNTNDIHIRITTTNRMFCYIYDNTNLTNIYCAINLTNVNVNDIFYIKYAIKNKKLIAGYSLDKINWYEQSTDLTNDFTYTINSTLVYGGTALGSLTSFEGSIDLPNSYIKLGGTKYNLQAVVGYTIVGSPTIVDGVVSGFSDSDYLRTSQNVNILSTANSWEIQTAFSVSDLTNSPQMVMGNAFGTSNGIFFAVFKDTDNTYTLRLYGYNNGALFTALPTTKFNTLTKYYVKIVFTGQQYKLLVSNDKINWNEIYSNNIDTNIGISNQYLFFGVDTRGNWSAFTGGQLYISETKIYQDNKLWFNGQEG